MLFLTWNCFDKNFFRIIKIGLRLRDACWPSLLYHFWWFFLWNYIQGMDIYLVLKHIISDLFLFLNRWSSWGIFSWTFLWKNDISRWVLTLMILRILKIHFICFEINLFSFVLGFNWILTLQLLSFTRASDTAGSWSCAFYRFPGVWESSGGDSMKLAAPFKMLDVHVRLGAFLATTIDLQQVFNSFWFVLSGEHSAIFIGFVFLNFVRFVQMDHVSCHFSKHFFWTAGYRVLQDVFFTLAMRMEHSLGLVKVFLLSISLGARVRLRLEYVGLRSSYVVYRKRSSQQLVPVLCFIIILRCAFGRFFLPEIQVLFYRIVVLHNFWFERATELGHCIAFVYIFITA